MSPWTASQPASLSKSDCAVAVKVSLNEQPDATSIEVVDVSEAWIDVFTSSVVVAAVVVVLSLAKAPAASASRATENFIFAMVKEEGKNEGDRTTSCLPFFSVGTRKKKIAGGRC